MPDEQQSQGGAPQGDPNKKKNTNTIIIVVIVIVALGGIGWWVSQRASEEVAEEAVEKAFESALNSSDVEFDVDDESVTITDEETGETATIGGSDIPDEFDSDLPIYSDADIQSVMSSTEYTSATVNWTSDADFEEIVDFYQDELEDSGWTVTDTLTSTDFAMMSFSKGDREGSVAVSDDGDEVSFTVTVSDKIEYDYE